MFLKFIISVHENNAVFYDFKIIMQFLLWSSFPYLRKFILMSSTMHDEMIQSQMACYPFIYSGLSTTCGLSQM